MPADLQFPLYALADAHTAKTIYAANAEGRRLLLFTSAEKASYYRRTRDLTASVVRLREPRDVRILLSAQDQNAGFDIEIDPDIASQRT